MGLYSPEALKAYPLPARGNRDQSAVLREVFQEGFDAGRASMRRVVSTVEELEALPTGSVILNHNDVACQRDDMAGWMDRVWFQTGSDVPEHMVYALPAVVLFAPDEGKING